MPPHLAMLTTLAATDEEVAARRTYGQLAGDGAGPCAKHAQVALRKAWEAGRTCAETVLEVSRLVLARPEKGLVTTQLGWLDKLAKKSTAPDEALLVVADAFAHERTDVQERALAVVAKHLAGADATTVAELVVAADALAPALRKRAAEVLGTAVHPDDAGSAGALSPADPVVGPPPPRGWPPGAADLGALAEDCAALVERLEDPVLLESVLAGVARFRNADRTAFDDALAPVSHRVRSRDVDTMSSMAAEFGLLAPPVDAATDGPARTGGRGTGSMARDARPVAPPPQVRAPRPGRVPQRRRRPATARGRRAGLRRRGRDVGGDTDRRPRRWSTRWPLSAASPTWRLPASSRGPRTCSRPCSGCPASRTRTQRPEPPR